MDDSTPTPSEPAKTTTVSTPSADDSPTAAVGGASVADIRKALKDSGVSVGSRGRLSIEQMDAYYALQANNFAPGADPNSK